MAMETEKGRDANGLSLIEKVTFEQRYIRTGVSGISAESTHKKEGTSAKGLW